MTFRKDFNNEALTSALKNQIKFSYMSFILVIATGLLFQYQFPIALSQSVNDPKFKC